MQIVVPSTQNSFRVLTTIWRAGTKVAKIQISYRGTSATHPISERRRAVGTHVITGATEVKTLRKRTECCVRGVLEHVMRSRDQVLLGG